MQAHIIYIRQPKATWIKLSSWAWFSIHNSINSEATPLKSIKHKTYCQQKRTRRTLLWLKNDSHKEWTSQALENLGMLCYIIMFFVFPENSRQQPATETGSYKHFHAETLALLAQAQSSSMHFTHTCPSSTTPKWEEDLCFHTAQTSASVLPVTSSAETGDAFWGRMSSMKAVTDCCKCT